MLQNLVARHVDARVRSRGQAYHASGAVTVLNGNSAQVQALVKGNDAYLVTLRRRGNRLRAWCTCPYCDENLEVCKHIWATLLAAEKCR
ncbi:MAG: SWIM zinc finger domain-containing protein, partial [Gemmataceae bacterium]